MTQIADSYVEQLRGAQCARILRALDDVTSFELVVQRGRVIAIVEAFRSVRTFGGADVIDCLAQAATWLSLEGEVRRGESV